MAHSAELLRETSQLWHNGGAGTASAHQVAAAITHCFNGLAAALTCCGKHDERLNHWLFFISNGDQRQCIQLHGKPKEVDCCPFAPAVSHPSQRKTFKERATAKHRAAYQQHMRENQQEARIRGVEVAGDLDEDRAHIACKLLQTILMPEGTVHFHIWRRDLVERVMAQRGLKRATSVPLKVWRRQLIYQWDNQPLDVSSTMLLGGLVCWECGAMPSTLRQCACRMAWYCSRQCQCAGWKGHHNKWCKPVIAAAAQAADFDQYVDTMKLNPVRVHDIAVDEETAVNQIWRQCRSSFIND